VILVRALALAVALAACGPSNTQIAKLEAARVAEEFPIVPMQLVIARGGRGAVVLSLAADGELRDGQTIVGAVKGTRVVGSKGEERVAVLGDGRITHGDRRTPLRFEKDELVSDNEHRISIDDAGNVVFAPPMRGQRARTSFRFEGFAPKARRTALLVLLLVVLENEKIPEDE
jgi:hypothetical protein